MRVPSDLLPKIKDLETKAMQAVGLNEQPIVQLNRNQLLQGLNADGFIIQNYYALLSQVERSKRGLQIDFVDLHFTNAFSNSFILVVENDRFSIWHNGQVPYSYDLVARYPYIFGLTTESIGQIKRIIIDDFIKLFRK